MAYTEEQFKKTTEKHRMQVLLDNGLYRHVYVGIPGTTMESWHIHTWPGYLAMVGDMGDWVFQRTEDMFHFFGSGRGINPGYWAEKIVAHEREGFRQFSIDAFHERIREKAVEACDVETWDEVPEERREELEGLLVTGDEYEAVAAQRDFRADWLDLTDFWDGDCTCQEICDRFLFACYAIRWTVELWEGREK